MCTLAVDSGDPAKEAALCDALGISAALAKILVGRGIDTPAAAAGNFRFQLGTGAFPLAAGGYGNRRPAVWQRRLRKRSPSQSTVTTMQMA